MKIKPRTNAIMQSEIDVHLKGRIGIFVTRLFNLLSPPRSLVIFFFEESIKERKGGNKKSRRENF